MIENIPVRCNLCGKLERYKAVKVIESAYAQTVKGTWSVLVLEGLWRAYCPECIIKVKTYARLKG